MVLNQQERKSQSRDNESFAQGTPGNETDHKAGDTTDHAEDQDRTCARPSATAPTSLSRSTEPNDQRLARSRARDPERERVCGEGDAESSEFMYPKCPRG
jgi:hypothetical protein